MRKKKQSNILVFSILTLFAIVTWIFVEAYKIINKKTFETIPSAVIEQLDPTLDNEVLRNVELGIHLKDEQLGLSSETVTASESAQASDSAQPQ